MSVEESVNLVLDSVMEAKGGEVFVTKMPVIKIQDLATVMIEELSNVDIEIIEIGSKPGEKLYEELMSSEETRRAIELQRFFCVLPAFRSVYADIGYEYSGVITEEVIDPYVSEQQDSLTVSEVKDFLYRNNLLTGSNDELETGGQSDKWSIES